MPKQPILSLRSARRVRIWGLLCLGAVAVMLTATVTPCSVSAYAAAEEEAVEEAVEESNPVGIQLSERGTQKWRMGLKIKAVGNITAIVTTLAVPKDWPEQRCKLIEQDLSEQVRKPTNRELDGVSQIVLQIPRLSAGEEAHALFVYEITKQDIDPPTDFERFKLPGKSAALFKYLAPSPYIETNDATLKAAAAQSVSSDVTIPWKQAEAIYDFVRDKVAYKFDPQIQSAVSAWKKGEGDCEELTSLFIAFCRNQGIPARAVWVPGHCYPEFYLVDDKGEGHWFPCQAAGDRDFGRMHEARPILQKGDNFRVPESRTALRYIQPFLKAANATSDPVVEFVLERVKADE